MTQLDEEVLQKLSPKVRARLIEAQGRTPARQATPSIGLNLALKGGLGYGRVVLIWGNKSSGKSSFLQQMIGMAQKDGKTCAWIDAEGSYDDTWASRLGVNSEKLILTSTKTVEGMTEECVDFCNAGVDIVVVDSISTLLGSAFFEDKGELKLLNDTKQIGNNARDMTNAINMINYANENTLVVFISQQRNSFGSMHATHIPTGGMGVKFGSSQVIKLWSSEAEKVAIKGNVGSGDLIFEERIGRPVNWSIDYSKLGPMGQSGQYDFYYQGDTVGVDSVGETLDYAVKYGIVKKGGAWYTFGEERIQGRDSAVAWLKQNSDIAEKLKVELIGLV